MKLCKKCGATQSDDRTVCVDCGEILGAPVDKATEEKLSREASARISKLDRDGDFLTLKPIDAACGIAMLVCGIASGVLCLFPKFAGEARVVFLISFLIGVVLGITALTPKFCWLLEKLRMSARVENTDDLIPSAWYIVSRKLCIYLGTVLVASMFTYALYAAISLRII
ncbi:MAG: hypothetical protein IJY86_03270 [Clostridia bacterium]|nr:hypothetical protein [Clostridia bacterium]